MSPATRTALRALLAADPVRTDAERAALAVDLGIAENTAPPDRLLRPREVMKRLSISRRTLTNYTRRGLLKPIVPHGNLRALGYAESSVVAFVTNDSKVGSEK